MNKTKMILAGTGGAIGLIVLVLAFLVWQAFSAKTAAIEGDDEEGTDGLETVLSRAQTLSRKPVYPCAASLAAIEKNQKAVDDWCKEGLALAARGDKVFPKTTPAQFKTDIVQEAKRLMSLPGAASGKFMKADFAFGPFKDYIVEGKMPAEAELVDLQRKWDDVVTFTELLSTNGACELLDVQFAAAKKAEEQANGTQGAGAKGKGNARGKKEDQAKSQSHEPRTFSYVLTFSVRPPALIDILNAMESAERFIVVDAFTFGRSDDALATALGGGEEKKGDAAQQTSGRRGRRGRRGAEVVETKPAAEEAGKLKNGIITDPVLDAPMTVSMTVSIHDFRSLEDGGDAEKGASK